MENKWDMHGLLSPHKTMRTLCAFPHISIQDIASAADAHVWLFQEETMKRLIKVTACLFAFLVNPAMAVEQLTFLIEDDPFQVNDKGEPYSATIDITKEIIKRVGMQETLKVMPWARAYEMTKNGPHMALLVGARTSERENQFKWVGPLDRFAFALYAKKGSGINIANLEEAKKIGPIGCVRNTVDYEILSGMGFTDIELVNNQESNVKKLMTNRVKLISQGPASIRSAVESAGFTMDDVELTVFVEDTRLYMMISKDVPDATIQLLQNTLEEIKAEGLFDKIFIKNNQTVPVFD